MKRNLVGKILGKIKIFVQDFVPIRTPVIHVQSQSQEVGSGDEGLGLLCFDLSSAETDVWWLEDEQ